MFAQDKTYRPLPNYVQIGKPDQAEGRRILEDFRQRGLATDMFFQFELRVLPRRGEGRTVPARLWIGRNEKGPVWRMELWPDDLAREQRLVVQNGPHSQLWSSLPKDPSQSDRARASAGPFMRLADTDITAFDLQMPFLFWNDFVFEGVARVMGRPAHVFLMYPPSEVTALQPELAGVRVYLDTQFKALVKTEQIGPADRLLKSLAVRSLKKLDDQYVPKQIDVIDENTRNTTRFAIVRAAVKLDLLPATFDPALLAEPVQPPPAARLQDVGP